MLGTNFLPLVPTNGVPANGPTNGPVPVPMPISGTNAPPPIPSNGLPYGIPGGVPGPVGGGTNVQPPVVGGTNQVGTNGVPHGFGPGGPVFGPPVALGHSPANAHHGENPLSTLFNGPLASEAAANPVQLNDEQHAGNVAQHLMQALQAAKDPNLRESLSNALAAIHKHVAGFQKERHMALQGKLSPRLMEMAQAGGHGAPNGGGAMVGGSPAQLQATAGNYQGAVQTWVQHHPYAVAHNQIPAYVREWQAAYTNAPAPGLAVS